MLIGGGALLIVDLLFFAANLTKLVHGAWLPLLIGLLAFTVMTSPGSAAGIEVTDARKQFEGPLRDFVDEVDDDGSAARHASRAPRSSWTATPRRRRWRCARASSTSTPCTSTS